MFDTIGAFFGYVLDTVSLIIRYFLLCFRYNIIFGYAITFGYVNFGYDWIRRAPILDTIVKSWIRFLDTRTVDFGYDRKCFWIRFFMFWIRLDTLML